MVPKGDFGMKKQLLTLLLCVALLLGMIPTAQAAQPPFTDVPSGSWYYNAVTYAYENNLFNGTSATTFSPELAMSRAMLVTVLYRLHGSPEVSGATPFADVPAGKYYTRPVLWANQNGIVTGITATTFAPDSPITREQMATILYRYAGFCREDISGANSLNAFSDRGSVSSYALPAVRWAVAAGIINGYTANTLAPKASATRAQVATILMRYVCYYDDDPNNDPQPGQEVPTADSVDSIQVGGVSYKLGMTSSQLTALAGQPKQILATLAGYNWWVYGTNTYRDFFLAGVYQDRVVALCTSGPGFSYMGYNMGDHNVKVRNAANCNVSVYLDKNDGNRFHCVLLEDPHYSGYQTVDTSTALKGESLADFYLVNAFRVYYNRKPLQWHDKVTVAARLHSADMAANGYFDHTGLNGSAPWDRVSAQGVSWRACGENIAYGYPSGVSVHNGWVNSAGHRSNILNPDWSHMGVGAARASNGRCYYTEDFILAS